MFVYSTDSQYGFWRLRGNKIHKKFFSLSQPQHSDSIDKDSPKGCGLQQCGYAHTYTCILYIQPSSTLTAKCIDLCTQYLASVFSQAMSMFAVWWHRSNSVISREGPDLKKKKLFV